VRTPGREVCIENFGDDSQVQQVHGIGDQADVSKKSYQYLRPFPDAFEFGQKKKTAKTFNEDSEHFCEKMIRFPMNVKYNVTGNNSDDKADIPHPVPEYRMPPVNVSGEDAQGNTVEAEDHHFLYPRSEVKFVHGEPGGDKNPKE
jgi:hypothetical protein